MQEFGVIGLGPAGCLFLACLPDTVLRRTVVFESGGVGGDLGRLWGNVTANLTRTQLAAAFHAVPRWASVPLSVLEKWDPDACPLLSDVALQLRELMKPLLSLVTLHSQHVAQASQILGGWRLQDTNGGEYRVAKLVVCTGGFAKQGDCARPCVPLEIALDRAALRRYVGEGDRVVVFGTAHSGTLVLRNLREAGCRGIVGVYRGAVPFRWARAHTPACPCHLLGGTGCHDSEGVKQESADIADEIVRGAWASDITLLKAEDTEAVIRAVIAADAVVYATGFQARRPLLYGLGGGLLTAYDSGTAQIAPGCWGFGLAYPALYEKPQGGHAPDIGLPGFVAHIQACLPTIL